MASSIPLIKNRPMFAHKCLGRISGDLILGNIKTHFDKDDSFIFIDDHKAYYPYRMMWDWATAAADTHQGFIGFTLTHNQSIDSELYNENGIWVNGKLHSLPAVQFSRNEKAPLLG